MAVDVSGSNFGFGRRTYHVGHYAGNGVGGTVETSASGGWFGHSGTNVTKKIFSISAAAGSRFGEVGKIRVSHMWEYRN